MSSRKIYLKFVQFSNICRILFLYTRKFFMRTIKVKIIDRYSILSNIESIEAVVQRCSAKKVFLEVSQNIQEITCARVSFLKETLAQVFSCECCEISKNTFLHRTPLVAPSKSILALTFSFTFFKY